MSVGAAGGPPGDAAVPVLYVGGYGRSGTTVLDILLGQHPRAVGVGELGALTRHAWAEDERCSCGATTRACPYWKRVVERWLGSEPGLTVERYLEVQARVEGLSGVARFLAGRAGKGEGFERYARWTAALLRAVAAEAGADLVVDSSKIPGRAAALEAAAGVDLKLIHMVRDGRGVAWSLRKPYRRDVSQGLQKEIRPKPLPRTALRWGLANAATEAVAAKLGAGRAARLRYEDFARDPSMALAVAERLTGLDYTAVKERLAAGEELAPGHQVAGNRLRMRRTVRLSPDTAWASEMPRWQMLAFGLLSGGMLRRYGYR